MSFNEILLEDKGGKNLHLEHLEDEILNYGVEPVIKFKNRVKW